jgi:hypothetical protein
MSRIANIFAALGLCAALLSGASPASAVTAEVAKKCRALMLKAHPYELPGNRKGVAHAQRDYFNRCVANEGNMPAEPAAAGEKRQ